MKTVRVYPVTAERVEGGRGQSDWIDPENAMAPGGGYAVAHGGSARGRFQNYTFAPGLPTFAYIHAIRLVANARGDSGKAGSINAPWHGGGWGDSLRWLEDGTLARADVTQLAVGFPAGSFEERINTYPQSTVEVFRANPWLRQRFSMFFYVLLQDWQIGDYVSVDYVAIEFDYTTPPTPWKCLFKLQPDHAIGDYEMKLLELKQGSTSENLLGVIRDATGAPLDLRGSEVTVTLKSKDHVASFLAEIVDAEAGEWRVPGTMGFAEVPGNYNVEVTLDWLDGTKTRLPRSGYDILRVWEALA